MGSFFRIGDKLLNREKVEATIERIFELRVKGLSQQEVAQQVGCDRSFVSRLESLAEVRKGGSIAVIGFPLENTEELSKLCQDLGVGYLLLLTDEERWKIIQSFDGASLLDWLMGIMVEMSDYDHVIMIGSDMRIRLAEAILGEKVFGITIGTSPITKDILLEPEKLSRLITTIKGD